jgi:hypothetical protein
MDSFTDIKNIIVGTNDSNGFITKVSNAVDQYLPISTTEKEKADVRLAISNAIVKEACSLLDVAHRNEVEENIQLKMLDGTANDLLQAGKLGKFLLVWRGFQRPLWNFGVFIFSFFWFFTDKIKLHYREIPDPTNINEVLYQADPITQTKLMVIIIVYSLVLGALFGERAFRNLIPLITSILSMFTGRKPIMKKSGVTTDPTPIQPKG